MSEFGFFKSAAVAIVGTAGVFDNATGIAY